VTFPGGAGSAQARLALRPDGRALLSWLEPTEEGVALNYSTFADGAFSSPREVMRGSDLFVNWADLPSVQPITADVWAAHWLRFAPDSAGAYHIATAVSADAGETWSTPVKLNDDEALAEHGFVELFAVNGAIGAFWLDGRQLAEWSFDEPDKLLGTGLRLGPRVDGEVSAPDEPLVGAAVSESMAFGKSAALCDSNLHRVCHCVHS